MTVYTKSMMESLAEVRDLQLEDNMDLMRKAAGGSAQNVKMKDGKLKMDAFTASAIMKVYDKVNPANKKKIETIINSGKKNQMMKLQSMAMKAIKSEYDAALDEETELDEGRMKELHGYIAKGMSAAEIAKKMKLDVKTIEALMKEEKRQLKDPKKETMVMKVKDAGSIQVIDKKDLNKFLSRGYIQVESNEEVELDEQKVFVFRYEYKGKRYAAPFGSEKDAKEAMKAGRRALEEVLNDPMTVTSMMSNDLEPADNSYSKQIQQSMTQSAGGKWKTNKITSNSEIEKGLVMWHNSPTKQVKDVPSYYRDLAMRMGINPINLANAQVRFLIEEEVQDDNSDENLSDVVKNLLYKFPTRGRITRARYEMQYGEQNVKTSIYNKKANTIKDE